MTVNKQPGTLGANKWAGSQPAAHDATRLTSGTLGAPRMRAFTLGTVKAGSMGSSMPPPATPHYLSLTVQITPAATNTATAALTQQRIGTISVRKNSLSAPVEHMALGGWVQPSKGTYRVRSAGSVSMLRWLEYDQR